MKKIVLQDALLSGGFSDISISALCEGTISHEIYLLACAAIANITFMDSQACDVLQQFEAPRLFIQASNTQKAYSLFVKDQVVFVFTHYCLKVHSTNTFWTSKI